MDRSLISLSRFSDWLRVSYVSQSEPQEEEGMEERGPILRNSQNL